MNASTIFTFAAAGCSILAICCTLAATYFSKAEGAQKAADAALLVQKQHQAQLDAVKGEATGGDSYPYAEMYFMGNTFKLSLHRNGNYTLYDIAVTIRDQNKVDALPLAQMARENPQSAIAAVEACDTKMSLGNLGTGGGGNHSMMFNLATVTIPEGVSSFSYVISIIARNGAWGQRIGGKKIGGTWQIGSHVEGPNVVDKNPQLSANFPRRANGDPDFEAEPHGPRPPSE